MRIDNNYDELSRIYKAEAVKLHKKAGFLNKKGDLSLVFSMAFCILITIFEIYVRAPLISYLTTFSIISMACFMTKRYWKLANDLIARASVLMSIHFMIKNSFTMESRTKSNSMCDLIKDISSMLKKSDSSYLNEKIEIPHLFKTIMHQASPNQSA